jgi:hypothetical protein
VATRGSNLIASANSANAPAILGLSFSKQAPVGVGKRVSVIEVDRFILIGDRPIVGFLSGDSE